MTAPTHYSSNGSLVVRQDEYDGNVQVHVWHRDELGVTLNLERNPNDDADVPQDVIAALSREDAAKVILALQSALHASNTAYDAEVKAEKDRAEQQARDAKLKLAPVVGDIVLIAPDPSSLAPDQRTDDGTGQRSFGSRWGEVVLINYLTRPASEFRAYVRVTLPGDAESKAAWLHVDYLTPVAVMARTRATATDAKATVTVTATTSIQGTGHAAH